MPEDFRVSVTFEKGGELPILRIVGEITSEAEESINKTFDSIAREKRSRVLLDFAETTYINSAGIATLISLITKSSEEQGKVEFVGLNSHFKKVMDIVGLTDFVIVHDSLESALSP